ncbi:MAG: RhuM family protein [Candidatus Eisenbacteria bacterium]
MATRKKTQRPTVIRDAARPPGGPGGEIVFYTAPNGALSLDVRLDRESIWLSHKQMALLFDKDVDTIGLHVRNVFKEGELDEKATTEDFSVVQTEGSRSVRRAVRLHNLDVVISVGYRVHSKLGTQFRIWATGVLHDHVLKGYSVNRRRLSELNQAVRLISDVAKRRGLSGDEATALLQVVGEYSHALDLLDDYDHQRVSAPASGGKTVHIVEHDEAMRIVQRLRVRFGGSELFGREKDNGLRSALGAVVQTFDGRDLYPSLEEKAALRWWPSRC